MSRTVLRACVELVAWLVAGTVLVLLLDTERRDWWLFPLVVVVTLALCVRVIVVCVRWSRLDNAFTRFSNRNEDAILFTVGPVALLLLWTTTSIDARTVVLTVLLGVALVVRSGQLWLRRSATRA